MSEAGTTEFGGTSTREAIAGLGDAVTYYFTLRPKKQVVQLVLQEFWVSTD